MLHRLHERLTGPLLTYLLLATLLWVPVAVFASAHGGFATAPQRLVALACGIPATALVLFVAFRFAWRVVMEEVRRDLVAELGSPYWLPGSDRTAFRLRRRLRSAGAETREILSTLLADSGTPRNGLEALDLLVTAENLAGGPR